MNHTKEKSAGSLFDDGGFDNGYLPHNEGEEILKWILLVPLFFITIFFVLISEGRQLDWIWKRMNQKSQIIPFSISNFAHAFAENWEWLPDRTYTRWMNHDLCDMCEDRNRKDKTSCENCYNNDEVKK